MVLDEYDPSKARTSERGQLWSDPGSTHRMPLPFVRRYIYEARTTRAVTSGSDVTGVAPSARVGGRVIRVRLPLAG